MQSNTGVEATIGMVFTITGVIFGQFITLGFIIFLLVIWDTLLGAETAPRLLLKLVGKHQLKVIVATRHNDNLEFYLNPKTDKENLEGLLKINKTYT